MCIKARAKSFSSMAGHLFEKLRAYLGEPLPTKTRGKKGGWCRSHDRLMLVSVRRGPAVWAGFECKNVSPSTLYRNAAGPKSPKMLMMGSQTERHCHPGGVTVSDSVPQKLAQGEADELSLRWSTPPCLRPRGAPGPSPEWRAGKSSVEMDAKPISALR